MSLNNHTRSLFTDQKSTLEGLQNISLAKVRDRINVYTSTTSTSLASTVTTSMGATGIARMVNRLMEECEVLRNDVAMAHQDIYVRVFMMYNARKEFKIIEKMMMEDGQIVAEELEEKVGRLGNDLKEVLRLSRYKTKYWLKYCMAREEKTTYLKYEMHYLYQRISNMYNDIGIIKG